MTQQSTESYVIQCDTFRTLSQIGKEIIMTNFLKLVTLIQP